MSAIGIPALLRRAVQTAQRRNVSVGELLADERLRWAAILTNGYGDNGAREVFGFVDLGIENPQSASFQLSQAMLSGELLEGDKRLPTCVTNFLFAHSGGDVWVRCNEEAVIVTPELFSELMLNHESEFDFEACGISDEWYLRFRSDDAVMFIAATPLLLSELSELLPGSVLPVEPDFVFAR